MTMVNVGFFFLEGNYLKSYLNISPVLSALRDGTSNQCEVPRDPRYPECPGKVDVSKTIGSLLKKKIK